jgi:hypothetical protein
MSDLSPRCIQFDLGIDSLVSQNDLTAMADSWSVGGTPVRHARISESAPALPNHLGPWAAALELPGLDCTALGRH